MKVENTINTIQNLGTILAKVVIFLYTPLQRNMTPAVGGQRITGKQAGVCSLKTTEKNNRYHNNKTTNNNMVSLNVDVSLQNNTIVMLDL